MVTRSAVIEALEFDGQVANHDLIRVPPDVAEQIPEGPVVHVIILLERVETPLGPPAF
jgi:hypothetical protein